MSRYFDLMQQVGIDDRPFATPRAARAPASAEERVTYQSRSRLLNDETLDLVQRIFLVPAGDPPRIVIFAGVDQECDASRICASVAETLASISKRPVCLVEGNFRSPNLDGVFGVANRDGLAEALAGDDVISDFCQPSGQENLWLLPSGPVDAGSPSLLTPENLKARFAELRDAFEFIIVHGPPVARYAEAMILGRMSDGLALVVEAGSTRREQAAGVAASLRLANIPIVAAVLNKAKSRG